MKSEHIKSKLIAIVGPTGIGKTATAMKVAETFDGEIIGADSMQIYRYMDIGTAKPTAEEQARVTHHMVDVVNPDQPFDAANYARMARLKAAGLIESGKAPILAGGTGFYIRAFLNGLSAEAATDNSVRTRLRGEAVEKGSHVLHARLSGIDPKSAQRIHPNDRYRIIRALEVYEITGSPMSKHQMTHQFGDSPYQTLKIGLTMDRDQLYARINQRVEMMLSDGLVDEVRTLLQRGYGPDLKPMQSIGYRHMVDYLSERLSNTEAVRTMKRDTRRYAKRQMTWFKKDSAIIWRSPDDGDEILDLVDKFLEGKKASG